MVKIKTDGLKLSAYRIRKGLKSSELAREIGISRSTMSDIERCNANPGPGVAKKIVEALGIGFDDVFSIVEGE